MLSFLNVELAGYKDKIQKASHLFAHQWLKSIPGPGIEHVSPELAGGFFTTEPPGKPPKPGIF